MKTGLLIFCGCFFGVIAKGQSLNLQSPNPTILPILKGKKKPLYSPIIPLKNYSINPLVPQLTLADLPKIIIERPNDEVYTSSLDGMGILIPGKKNCSNMPIAVYRENKILKDSLNRRIIPGNATPQLLPNFPLPLTDREMLPLNK
jgi:hypothetical protein